MKKSDMYNKIAETRNWETITTKEAKRLANSRFIKWFEIEDDTILITIGLRGEEHIRRTYRIA